MVSRARSVAALVSQAPRKMGYTQKGNVQHAWGLATSIKIPKRKGNCYENNNAEILVRLWMDICKTTTDIVQ
jgi:hypothetical protein